MGFLARRTHHVEIEASFARQFILRTSVDELADIVLRGLDLDDLPMWVIAPPPPQSRAAAVMPRHLVDRLPPPQPLPIKPVSWEL